jgi:hypothetical protein
MQNLFLIRPLRPKQITGFAMFGRKLSFSVGFGNIIFGWAAFADFARRPEQQTRTKTHYK